MHLAVLSRSDGFQRGGADDGRNRPPQAVIAPGTAFYAWPPALASMLLALARRSG